VARPPIDAALAAAGLPPLPRSAWLEIDTDALAGNLRALAALVPGAALTAVVKADGYGHGAEVAARTFLAAGADSVAVATIDEAHRLRAAGIEGRILVLFRVPPTEIAGAAAAGFELVASDRDGLDALAAATLPAGGRGLGIHLEIETGLSRAGLRPADAAEAARRIAATRGARLASVWSHLATPEDAAAVAAQLERFSAAVDAVRGAGVHVPERHVSASGGLLAGAPGFERVRPGLSLYGVAPAIPAVAGRDAAVGALRPAMALRARPIRVERLVSGESVGYGGTWTATRDSVVATLPVGYGDGWARAYAGGDVLVAGRRVPLLGTIAMDACAVDVTDVPGLGAEATFTLLGSDGDESSDAAELARRRNTIAWEVLATMAPRLPRVYHASAGPTGMRTTMGEVAAAAGGPLPGDV